MHQSLCLPALFTLSPKVFFKKLLPALLWAVISCASLLAAGSVNAENAHSPEVNVAAFYKWYLHSMAQNKDPLSDDRDTLSKYVSGALIKEIDKRMRSPEGLDADYFIQAQDYLDDWESNISIGKTEIKGKTATMLVTLGATKESKYRLALTLNKEGDLWKIRKIRRA